MSLTIDDIVSVNIDVASMSVAGRNFNTGLIIGNHTASLSKDVITCANLTEVAEAGFATTSEIYKAAVLYFAQDPAPTQVAIAVITDGASLTDVLANARAYNSDWYGVTFAYDVASGLTQDNIVSIATTIDAMKPETVWFNTLTNSETYLTILGALKGNAKRTISIYTSAGVAAGSALMGLAMGKNYADSPAFTLAYKSLSGVSTEGITSSQLNAIIAAYGNVYVQQGSFNVLRQGKMANGISYDDVLLVDMLANGLQTEVINMLKSENKIPQTDEGTQILITALTKPCENMLSRNYLDEGVWKRARVKTLATGDTLTRGYKIMADSVDEQSQTDRDARKAPTIYICAKTSGAVEYVTINLTVNR